MSQIITQTVVFKNISPKALYKFYMNEKKHAKLTGAKAKISSKEGSKFSLHGAHITGRNLQLIKNKMMVQSWRTKNWFKADIDSTLIILLTPKGSDTELHLTQINVPQAHVDSVTKGWDTHYWGPWKKYLQTKLAKKAAKAKPAKKQAKKKKKTPSAKAK